MHPPDGAMLFADYAATRWNEMRSVKQKLSRSGRLTRRQVQGVQPGGNNKAQHVGLQAGCMIRLPPVESPKAFDYGGVAAK